MKCHEVDYTIIGDDMQMVEVELDPGETVIAEAGAMNYMDDGIDFEAKMGDGSSPDKSLFGKLLDAGTRKLTGESIFMTHFTNQATGKKRAAFAAPYPGRIVPLDLGKIGGEILCQKDAFLALLLVQTWVSPSTDAWAQASSVARALFSRDCVVMGWCSCMRAATRRHCEWTPDASSASPRTCTTTFSGRGISSRCSSAARVCFWRR